MDKRNEMLFYLDLKRNHRQLGGHLKLSYNKRKVDINPIFEGCIAGKRQKGKSVLLLIFF